MPQCPINITTYISLTFHCQVSVTDQNLLSDDTIELLHLLPPSLWMTFVLLAAGIYPFSSSGLFDEVLWQNCLGDNTINLTTQPSPSQGAHGPLGGSVVRRVSSTASCSIKMTACPFAPFSPGVEPSPQLTLMSCFCQGSW